MEVGRSTGRRLWAALAFAAAALVVAGCGSSEPEHPIQPLTSRPPATNDFTKLTTPEEKIKFIQSSKAPESEKQKAIAQVQAGKL